MTATTLSFMLSMPDVDTTTLLFLSLTTFQLLVAAKNLTYHNRQDLDALLKSTIADHAFPGACLVIGSDQQTFVDQSYGTQTYQQTIHTQLTDLFDLASLVKSTSNR